MAVFFLFFGYFNIFLHRHKRSVTALYKIYRPFIKFTANLLHLLPFLLNLLPKCLIDEILTYLTNFFYYQNILFTAKIFNLSKWLRIVYMDAIDRNLRIVYMDATDRYLRIVYMDAIGRLSFLNYVKTTKKCRFCITF